MIEAISNVLDELEAQSTLEKSRKVDVPPEDRMLAITKDTGELLNMILRIKNVKNMLEVGTSTGYSTIWWFGRWRKICAPDWPRPYSPQADVHLPSRSQPTAANL